MDGKHCSAMKEPNPETRIDLLLWTTQENPPQGPDRVGRVGRLDQLTNVLDFSYCLHFPRGTHRAKTSDGMC